MKSYDREEVLLSIYGSGQLLIVESNLTAVFSAVFHGKYVFWMWKEPFSCFSDSLSKTFVAFLLNRK